MDPLSDILSLLKPATYGFRGLSCAGDWALSFKPAPGIRCFAIEYGACWLRVEPDVAPLPLIAGDVVLLTAGNEAVLFSSDATAPSDAVAFLSSVPPGQVAVINGGSDCRGIGGFFGLPGRQSGLLLQAIPPIMHVRSDSSRLALLSAVQRLMRELSEPKPGGTLLANHLAQALLVEALRAHLENGHAHAGWLAGLAHPAMHRALAAMHGDVARRWTLESLAREAGMSRSSFASHFERVTGETPIAYLTRWRMELAADQLASGGSSLPAIAASVGYDSESAFSTAFKRVTGRSPRDHGRAERAATPVAGSGTGDEGRAARFR